MTILASPEPTITNPAETLRRLADHLDALPHARISPPDVFAALRHLPAGRERQSALNLLHRKLRHTRGFEEWLYHWTGPESRVEVVALVRAAAEQAEQVSRG